MTENAAQPWRWVLADDADEVHRLLTVCDGYQAARSATSVPVRRIDNTRELVAAAKVHVLRHGAVAAAMFTLGWDPPDAPGYPPARRPARLSRLAVQPELLEMGSMAGVQCVRKAIEKAGEWGADSLRAEANPDLVQTRALLGRLGFGQCGPVETTGDRRWVRLHREVRRPATRLAAGSAPR